jgi:hypothetical protein
VDPWVARGRAGEVLQADAIVPGEASTQNLSWSGFLPTVSGGVDLAMTGPLSVGPYAQLGIGQYTRGPQGAIASRATHAWVQLGLKVTMDL